MSAASTNIDKTSKLPWIMAKCMGVLPSSSWALNKNRWVFMSSWTERVLANFRSAFPVRSANMFILATQLSKLFFSLSPSGESLLVFIWLVSKRDSRLGDKSLNGDRFEYVIAVWDSVSIFSSLVLWAKEDIGEFVAEFTKSASLYYSKLKKN